MFYLAANKQIEYDQIPLDLIKIASNLGSIDDITLCEGDELYISKFNTQVTVSKSILLETQLPYDQGSNFADYVSGAGGGIAGMCGKRSVCRLCKWEGRSHQTFLFLF